MRDFPGFPEDLGGGRRRESCVAESESESGGGRSLTFE